MFQKTWQIGSDEKINVAGMIVGFSIPLQKGADIGYPKQGPF
jgi:hypothetical protein